MMKRNLPRWPCYSEEEIQSVAEVIRSGKVNYWTGKEGKAFEKEYADSIGTEYGIAMANGSVALELALYGVGVEPGAEVIVTPRSFIASASCVPIVGGVPVFADVDPISGNISGETIERVITDRTKAVIPVHLGGRPCEMDGIMAVAKKYSLSVIEDCAQAHGAVYRGKPVGSIGDVGVFSFCQDKIISTGGEGGIVATSKESLWGKMWSYKDHGKDFDTVFNREHPPGFRWLHESFGTNLRMTEMQAAIGRIQLSKLADTVNQRRRNANVLTEFFRNYDGVSVPLESPDSRGSYYRFYAYVNQGRLRSEWSRDRVMNEIVEKGAPCFSGTCSEIYLEEAFKNTGFAGPERLPNAKLLGETSLMFPVYSTLSVEDMNYIGEIAGEVLKRATR
jgi:dTDP-4-amino-4,6-dideoxygalactose transaminase